MSESETNPPVPPLSIPTYSAPPAGHLPADERETILISRCELEQQLATSPYPPPATQAQPDTTPCPPASALPPDQQADSSPAHAKHPGRFWPRRRAALPDPPGWYEGVQIIDTPQRRVHHPRDLISIVMGVLGVGLVFLITFYAHETTQGVTQDARNFAAFLRQLLFVPVTALVTFVTAGTPLLVLIELALNRMGRLIIESMVAALAGIGLGYLGLWGIEQMHHNFSGDFMVGVGIHVAVSLPIWATSVVALLIVAGPRGRRASVRWSWNLLWIALIVVFLTAQVTIPGAVVGVLLGMIAGHLVRYISGVASERAYGLDLISGVRRAGFDPARLVRIRDVSDEDVAAANPALSTATLDDIVDPAGLALTRLGANRVYAMTTPAGKRFDLVVLDGDRHVMGTLTRSWRSIRLRGIEGRSVMSLRQAAERAALLAMAATRAGVRTPELLAIATAQDSMLMIQRHPGQVTPLRDVPTSELTDDVLDAMWGQVKLAHDAGLAHRGLSSDTILLGPATAGAAASEPRFYGPSATRMLDSREVWLTGWEFGDVASAMLAQRMDVAAMLALIGLRAGALRAVESAVRVLGLERVTAAGPLVQIPVLPTTTREMARRSKQVLPDVRAAIIGLAPEADVHPEPVERFGVRSVLTWIAALVALFLVLGAFNFQAVMNTLKQADPRWVAVAFALGLVTFLGSAISLVAFSPIKLPLWRAVKVQVAAAFIALVAPAGVGPAALNLRMLTKLGVAAPLAVASVSIVQVSQLITTLALLVVLGFFSGHGSFIAEMPSPTVLLATLLIAIAIAATMFIPQVRTWLVRTLRPMVQQTWPRLVAMLSQPRRLLLAVVGNLIMTLGYIAAFQACLLAFNRPLTWINVAIIYLVGNAAGAAVPTPGGIGAIEFAFFGQLTAAGLGGGVATSVALLFRVLTYWCRIPLGWIAMRNLQKRDQL